jgi:hypothetical protein
VSEADPTPPGAEELVAELQKAKVDEFLVHTCSLLASLAYGKLGAQELDQARLAIDALKALQPLAPEEVGRELQGVVASLQLAFADAAAPPG